MNLVILGPPDSGKSTQSRLIASRLQLVRVFLGDKSLEGTGSDCPTSRGAHVAMKEGKSKPNSIVAKLFELAIQTGQSSQGFVFDGLPRTAHQAQILQQILDRRGVSLNLAVELIVGPEEVRRRLCNQSSHNASATALEFQREVYEEDAAQVRAFYRERGMYVPVAGDQAIELVAEAVYRETWRASMPKHDRVLGL